MRLSLILILLLHFTILSGCNSNSDAHYDDLIELDEEARLERFKEFGVIERLRLYEKFYDNSGHPRDSLLSNGFSDMPEPTFWAILGILSERKYSSFSFHNEYRIYNQLIFQLSLDGFDVCRSDRYPSFLSVIDPNWMSEYRIKLPQGCFIP